MERCSGRVPEPVCRRPAHQPGYAPMPICRVSRCSVSLPAVRIMLVTPASRQSRAGNRTTALRWARVLRELGHTVRIVQRYEGGRADLMIALHAYKSAVSMARFRALHPGRPLIVALTGTDLYQDLSRRPEVRRSMEWAVRLVVLQEKAVETVPEGLRDKTRVIYQSATPLTGSYPPAKRTFDACVIAHLRDVKDPLRAAQAARSLPDRSRVRVVHAGRALSAEWEERARFEAETNFRYRWRGELPRWKARQLIARSRILVLTSKLEGGANVVTEALVQGVPVISSRIDGSIGMLGEDYPGYFPVGDTEGLAQLLKRAEQERPFYTLLKKRCRERKTLFEPRREREAWRALLAELG